MTSLPSKDLFFARERFSLGFSKFSISRSFFRYACHCFIDYVVLVCLERKWTYQCPDSRFFISLTVPIACLGEKMGVLMSRSRVFLSPYLLLCRHCVYVVDSHFLLSLRCGDGRYFSPVIDQKACYASFCSQIHLGLDYSPSKFYHFFILLRQC